jgi:hypothetical protein
MNEDYYMTDRVRASASCWGKQITGVLHGVWQGKFIALTIRVQGSAWICHPHRLSPDAWNNRNAHGKDTRNPPRWVRKAAKMALQRWLN